MVVPVVRKFFISCSLVIAVSLALGASPVSAQCLSQSIKVTKASAQVEKAKKAYKKAKSRRQKLKALKVLNTSKSNLKLAKKKLKKCLATQIVVAPSGSPSPSGMPSPVPSVLPSTSPSSTPSSSPSPSPSGTPSVAPSASPSHSPVPSPSSAPSASPSSLPSASPSASPSSSPSPSPIPPATPYNFVSRVPGIALSVPVSNASYSAIANLIASQYVFHIIEADTVRWVVRCFWNGNLIGDYLETRTGTVISTSTPAVTNLTSFLNALVTFSQQAQANFAANSSASFAIYIPDQSNAAGSFSQPFANDYYGDAAFKTLSTLIEGGILFAHTGAVNAGSIIGKDQNNVTVYSSVNVSKGIITGANGSITLFSSSLTPADYTFANGTEAYAFVNGTPSNVVQAFADGLDISGSPKVIYILRTSGNVELLLVDSKLRLIQNTGALDIINNANQSTFSFSTVDPVARRIAAAYAIRNYLVTGQFVSGGYNITSTSQISPDVFQIVSNAQGLSAYYFQYLVNKVGGGTAVLDFIQNRILYLLGGVANDLIVEFGTGSILAQGDIQNSGSGSLIFTVEGETWIIYASGVLRQPDNSITIPPSGTASVFNVATNNAAYAAIDLFLANDYALAFTSESATSKTVSARKDTDPNIYEIITFNNGQLPQLNTITPQQQALYNLLYFQIASNILNLQYQTSMNIISNFPGSGFTVNYVY